MGTTERLQVVALPGAEDLAAALTAAGAEQVGLDLHVFPDGESCVRLLGDVSDRTVVLAARLDQPDARVTRTLLAAATLRDLGAARIVLAVPYLPYLRQDHRFRAGQGVSARYVATWISAHVDGVVTVDPHLHRLGGLAEIFAIPARVVPAAPAVARWLATELEEVIVVGPDDESAQWVEALASALGAPHVVLDKERFGDADVRVSAVPEDIVAGRTPIVFDDIASTGSTLVEACRRLAERGAKAPWCVAVHGLFVGDAEARLAAAGAARIASTNTVVHGSNAVDVLPDLATAAIALASDLAGAAS